MPKLNTETYIEYKHRVIDPVSNSFCAAKWLNSTIWLGSGMSTSCHHPPAHKIDVDEIKTNPSAIHNTAHKKLMRKFMLEGIRPDECEYCWKIEDVGRDNTSDRVFKTVIYSDEKINEIAKAPWDDNIDLETLEIAFDRTCNFACSYCNASFSTTWAKDIKITGPYTNLISDGAGAYTHDGAWADATKDKEENPYIKAFWDWWPTLSKSLKELRITGGEPLMSDDVWKLMDKFGDEELNIQLAINSNLGGKDALIDRFIEKSKRVKNLHLYTSCEAYGAQAEYIRDGLDYRVYKANLIKILEHANVKQIGLMMTINSLCLFSITDFIDEVIELKRKYGANKIALSLNLLRFPSFMSPLALPDHIKDDRRKALKDWYETNKSNTLLREMEKDSIVRLIDYLEVVEGSHRDVSDKEVLWKDFKSFYEQYDTRRNKNFKQVFPTIADWYDSLSAARIIPIKSA